ncbi:glycosyltransferase [Anaerolinea thermolimosa]|uniref:glycosyltransferase n=1 Tax=Anaerolinea thermolimosa TaxID=229919 RepID=UPI0007832609|nr:glycosyltransferase [Anaerolinea thermolimosa]GAP07883.1 glycosyltransferase [Anaerolinea thermolimosa]
MLPVLSKTTHAQLAEIDRAIELVQRANGLMEQGAFSEAVVLFDQILESFPDLPEVNLAAAKAYFRLGERRKAMIGCINELVNDPQNGRALNFLYEMHLARLVRGIRLEFNRKIPPKRWPSISLVMIVKNEEAHLERCLDSVKDMVSEMIIVDTGSTDRTVEIARAYGAKVYHFDWCDDFAAARNESLKHATGEWLLMMDADNWLEPEDKNQLLWAAASGKADVYLCKQLDWNTETTYRGSPQARLFRNLPGLYYQSALHENILPSARQLGLTIALTEIKIQHIKFILDATKLRQKRERNLNVLRKALEKAPDNLEYQVLVGTALDELEQHEEAFATLEPILLNLPDHYVPDIHLRQAYVIVANAYIRKLEFAKLDHLLRQMVADFPDSVSVWVGAGSMYLNGLGRPEVALEFFGHAERLPCEEEDLENLGTKDLAALLLRLRARAALYAGQVDRARELLVHGWKSGRRFSAGWREKMQALLADGKYHEVLNLLSPVPLDPDALKLAGQAAMGTQQWGDAAAYLAMAAVLSAPDQVSWKDLAICEFKSGSPACCLRACQLGLEVHPDHPDLLAQAGAAAWQLKDVGEAFRWFVHAVVVHPQDTLAQKNLEKAASEIGMTSTEAVRKQALIWTRDREYRLAYLAWEQVVACNPMDQQAVQLHTMLRSLA